MTDPQSQNGWFKTPNVLIDRMHTMPKSAVLVLLVLLRYADVQGRAWPSVGTLQRMAGVRKRTLFRALAWLDRHGFIRRIRRKTATGADLSSMYELQPPLLVECHKGTTGSSQMTLGWFPNDTGGVSNGNHEEYQREEDQRNKTIYCSEPSKKASEPQPSEKAVMTFTCVGTGPSEWTLTAGKLQEYRDAFPGIDVLSECRRARQWLIDNPPRRKTAKGMPRFLNSWLSRAQDRAGRNGQPMAKPKSEANRLRYLD